MSHTILITGATGRVGAEIAKQLATLPPNTIKVRLAMRDIVKGRAQFGDAFDYVPFDLKQPDTFSKAFEGVDRLFLMRPPTVDNIKDTFESALNVAHTAGVKHIVYLSVIGAGSNRLVPHHQIEKLIEASGMDWTFLRAGYFMQNMNTIHRDEIRERNEIFVPAGTSKTNMIDVRDIAAVGVLALTQDGHARQAYTLTGSQALDYYEVADQLTAVLGRPIQYKKPSLMQFWRQQRQQHADTIMTVIMTVLYTTARLGLAADVSPETAQLLGRAPIRFRQYAQDYKSDWQ